jgi:hypothetical protein
MNARSSFAAAAIAGLSRSSWRPCDGEPAGPAALRALALASQQQRLASSEPALEPVPSAAAALHADPLRILSPESRLALKRLLEAPGERAERLYVVLERLERIGWRLHPFDLPPLEKALAAERAFPGAAERAFLQLTGRDATDEPVTIESWGRLPRGLKLSWLRWQRREDPPAARAMTSAVMAREPADLRIRLGRIIANHPTAEDEPLLRRLLTDRHERVRDVALQGLQGLAGTPESKALVLEVARTTFRRSAQGKVTLAGDVRDRTPNVPHLASISLVDVAAALQVDTESVLLACHSDRYAVSAGAHGLLLAGHYEAFARLAELGRLSLRFLDHEERHDILGARPMQIRLDVLRWLLRPDPDGYGVVGWRNLAWATGGTLPADVLAHVVTWPDWAKIGLDATSSLEVAAATPRAAAEAMLAAFEPAPAAAEPARLFLRFLLTLPGDAP